MSTHSQNGRPRDGHLNEQTMQKYQARSLAVEEQRAADRHLKGCGTCRRVLLARMGPVRLPEEIAELPEPLHLSYEQLTAFIDDALTAPEKQRVEAHLFLCADCTQEVADLRKLDVRLAAAAVVKASEPKESIGVRLARFFSSPGRAREWGLAFGAIVVGVFLFQAGHGSGPVQGVLNALHIASEGNSGLNLGAYALVICGVAYLVYSFLRKR